MSTLLVKNFLRKKLLFKCSRFCVKLHTNKRFVCYQLCNEWERKQLQLFRLKVLPFFQLWIAVKHVCTSIFHTSSHFTIVELEFCSTTLNEERQLTNKLIATYIYVAYKTFVNFYMCFTNFNFKYFIAIRIVSAVVSQCIVSYRSRKSHIVTPLICILCVYKYDWIN